MDELLPVLVTNLADERARVYLTQIALANEVAVLPLLDAPVDATLHVIEVHAPGGEPLLLLAEPQGPGTERGFPLRLRPMDEDQAAVLFASLPAEDAAAHPSDDDAPTLLRQSPNTRKFNSELSPMHLAALGGQITEPPPEVDPLINHPIAGGKFLIQELLGAGGAGKVYKARHRELRKPIAVKVLHSFFQKDLDFCARFYGEALAASKLDHPNVLRIVDFGQEPDGMLYIAMEYLEGKNLQQVIDREGAQPLDRIVNIMMQVCAALTVAHEKGIVHRDIKPENIVIVSGRDDDGNPMELVKVCDFGIAQLRNPDESVLPAPVQRQVAGTPEYMSPEQCRGEDLDERSDIYACGITAYELATGRVPFTAQTAMALLSMHVENEPPPPSQWKPDLDPLLEDIVLRAIRKDRGERQQTARELRGELRQLLEPIVLAQASDDDDEPPSIRSISMIRREVREALPALEHESVRFQEFFVAFAGAVSRTTYYERGHKESMHALARLMQAADVILKYRGEVSFARRDVGETVVFSVLSGIGEVYELKRLVTSTIYSMYAQKFGEVFVRRSIVALSIEDGISESQLATMVELLSGPEIGAEELRSQFLAKGLTQAKILLASDLLGRERRLPWQVDLCISRLARDLRALPLLKGLDTEAMLQLRMQLIADVVRALPRPDQVRILLENADLIADEVRHIPELARYDTLRGLVDALPRIRAVQVAQALIEGTPPESGGASAGAGDRALRVLPELTHRFVRERSVETDDVLKAMHARGVLPLETLPEDLQTWVYAEQTAELLIQRPDAVLRPLEGQIEAARFKAHMVVLERALTTLAQRGEARSLSITLAWLRRLQGPRAEMASQAARSLEDPAVLEPIGRTLFSGIGDARDAAHAVLVLMGPTGARALFMARVKEQVDQGARARFVGTMRRIGRPAWPTLIAALQYVQPAQNGQFDAALAEDVLRALPEVQDEEAGSLVAKLVRHGGPPVCRAAVSALAALWGPRARPLLVAVLENEDDGVRIAALGALRKVGGIDEHVVVRVEKMLAKGGKDLRAAAAAALADVPPRARELAIGILKRSLVPQTKGVLARLRGPGGIEQEPLVVLALSRAIVAIAGGEGVEAVETRAAYCDEPLRSQLFDLLPPA